MKRLILLFFIVWSTLLLMADPANPHPHIVFQPDGDSITLIFKGDEYAHWRETKNGLIVMRDTDGFWKYAMVKKGTMVPSSIIARENDSPNACNPSFNQQDVRALIHKNRKKNRARMNGGTKAYDVKVRVAKVPIRKEWVDHKAEACGVKDPIVNLDWMQTALAREKRRGKAFQVELRKSKETGEKVFVFSKKDADGNYVQFDVYNCAGEKIYYYEFINAIIPKRVLSKYKSKRRIYMYNT